MLMRGGSWIPALALAVLCALTGGAHAQSPAPGKAEPLAAWVQLVDGGVAEARAVIDGPTCPEATVDGQAQAMSVRAPVDAAAFPQTVCALTLPKAARSVSVAGRTLPPPPPAQVNRILVFGDTGCRIHPPKIQDCNDPRAWPFTLVARRAAAEKPDLVIHVGDYYYRELPCPAGYAGCANSPHGDLWPSWQADFFDPSRPLLDAAPWVFARGNHEACNRGWKGWFRMLDAAPYKPVCDWGAAAFAVPIGGLTLHVFDSADAEDRVSQIGEVHFVQHQLDSLPKASATHEDWIVTHRPFWGEAPVFSLGPLGVFNVGLNRTEQAAAQGKDLSAVAMIVSGHIHHFASFDFGPARPAQLVVGTGGDIGETFDPAKLQATQVYIDGLEADTLTFQQYGYFLLERGPSGWTGMFKDLDGKPVARCTLEGRRLSCSGVKS